MNGTERPPPGHTDRADSTPTTSTLSTKKDPPQGIKVVEAAASSGWRDLLTERPQPSPEMLASPTLGNWRRANGVTTWSDYVQVYFATLLVEEAQRRVLLERLDGIMQFLVAGARPDQAVDRLVDLIDEYHGAGTRLTRRELAA